MSKAEPRSITRRSFVAALALPALASEIAAAPSGLPGSAPPDPTFAAIAAHARACAALEGFADTLADAEQTAWHAPRGKRRAANKRR